MNYWLRLYTGILDDPKVQRLEAEHFKGWVNVLCIAKENDGLLPSIGDMAFLLRMTEAETNSLIAVLAKCGLIDRTDFGPLTPHNWHKWQNRTCDLLRGDWSDIRLFVLERDDWQCQYCGADANAVDHILARSRGGTNNLDNLVAACHHCNSRKHNKTPEEAGMRLLNKGVA